MTGTGFPTMAGGYFFGTVLLTGIPVGALGLRIVHALTGGAWGEEIGGRLRAASRALPLAALLWVPVFFMLGRIYLWASPGAVPMTSAKALYMSPAFFVARTLFYFAVWIGSSWWLDRRNDAHRLEGLLAVAYVLFGSFAAIDWVMSLEPRWQSTIFGLLYVIGEVLLGYAVLIAVHGWSRRRTALSAEERRRFIDLGNILLTLVMLWAYLVLSQFLIIWMANKPDEISWYLAGTRGRWSALPVVLGVGHFLLPFLLLLRREWKANPLILAGIASWIILMRVVDVGWMVFPGLVR